jgi:hypothetical protein
MTVHIPSDTVHFNSISTGGNNAGNGGTGINYGNITDNAHIDFNPTNKAYGSDVHVNTGDDVYQKASWDAGSASAHADKYSTAVGGSADSNGDQHNYSGHDTSTVSADTTAYQSNWLAADQSQYVVAGVGGNGGNDNYAVGGDVHLHI